MVEPTSSGTTTILSRAWPQSSLTGAVGDLQTIADEDVQAWLVHVSAAQARMIPENGSHTPVRRPRPAHGSASSDRTPRGDLAWSRRP